MLLNKRRERLGLPEALFWATSWGLGAAIGVALGGWLTLVGGSGAPGVSGLDPAVDLGLLPLGAFCVVATVHLFGQLVAAVVRGRAVPRG